MNTRVWSQSISAQTAATESGAVTAEELVAQTRAQIDAHESDLQAWVQLSPDIGVHGKMIDGSDERMPLRGVSVAVKDLIDVEGLPTRAGSIVTASSPVERDAACVARLRALGAVVQGKTVTTEFGYFAPGPTRNPHAHTHTPGGSSSGSAAAVGAGTIPLALGTQTAGSLTRPASYCGAAGLVLAHGCADLSGITGLSDSLDTLGLLTRSVDDLRVVHRAFAGATPASERNAGASTVFVWSGSELDEIASPMRRLVQQLPLLINNLGFDARPLQWDDHVHTLAADHLTVMAREAADTRAAEFAAHEELLSTPFRRLIEQGNAISTAEHHSALMRRDRSRAALFDLLGTTSLIVGPAAPGPAPAGLSATGSPVLSRPWQLMGLPVVIVPGARTTTGLPLGVQIIGTPGREPDMLDLGVALESLLRGVQPFSDTAR